MATKFKDVLLENGYVNARDSLDYDKLKWVGKMLDYLVEIGYISSKEDLIGTKNDLNPKSGYPSNGLYHMLNNYWYLLDPYSNPVLSDKEIKSHRSFNKFVKLIRPLANPKQTILDKDELLKGRKKKADFKKDIQNLPDEPLIWTPNHCCKEDVISTVLAALRQANIVFGSLPQFYSSIIDGTMAYANGVYIINRKNPSSKNNIIYKCLEGFKKDVDTIIYAEGGINKFINQMIQTPWPGIYRLCEKSGCKVMPILHYPEKLNGKIYSVVGDPIRLDDLSEEAASKYWREVMMTWYYYLMEIGKQETREKALNGEKSSLNAWEVHLQSFITTMDYYDRDVELKTDYRPRYISPEEYATIDKFIEILETLKDKETCSKKDFLNSIESIKEDLKAIVPVERLLLKNDLLFLEDELLENLKEDRIYFYSSKMDTDNLENKIAALKEINVKEEEQKALDNLLKAFENLLKNPECSREEFLGIVQDDLETLINNQAMAEFLLSTNLIYPHAKYLQGLENYYNNFNASLITTDQIIGMINKLKNIKERLNGVVDPVEVWEPISKIKSNPGKGNVEYALYATNLVRERKKSDTQRRF